MNMQNCSKISTMAACVFSVMPLFLEGSLSGASMSRKRDIEKISAPDMYSAAVELAQQEAEDIFAHEEAKKHIPNTNQRTSKRATLSTDVLIERGIVPGTNSLKELLLETGRALIKTQSTAQGIVGTPELETFSNSFASEMLSHFSQQFSTLVHVHHIDERTNDIPIAFPSYSNLIDEKDFVGLLKCLHFESRLFTMPFKTIVKQFSDICDKATPLSVNQVDDLIKSIRNFVSYGATFEEIDSIGLLLETHIGQLVHLCGSLAQSTLYKPFPGQSVAQAFVGYALLPMQFDIRFESISELLLRARLLYLTVLSATCNNHFAISCIGVLWNENEDEEYPLNKKISELRAYAESHQADEQNQPLYYYAREVFEKLETDKAEAVLKAAFHAGDMRGAFAYMVNLNKEDLSDAIFAKLAEMNQEAYACLLTAETHEDMAERKKNYEVAGRTGYAYAYYQLGLLSLRERNRAEALKYFCLAFQKGLYSAHKNIYELCNQLGAEGTLFSEEYKKLCSSFCGEIVDDEMHQKLEAALLN
jgi:hypothetical protein